METQKCTRCKKALPSHMFANKTKNQPKTCYSCHSESSIHYKQSHQSESVTEILSQEEMSNKLYEQILEINTNEYFENESAEIDFKCNILLDINEEDPQKLSKIITELLGNADGYYYIYKDCYSSTKDNKPRKQECIENQRDQIPIDRFDCNGRIKIVLNLRLKSALIHLQHLMLHKRPERFGVNETIKEEIKKNIHLSPSKIYQILENYYPNLTQKQVHAWWSTLLKQEYVRDNENQLNSAKRFLIERGYRIVLCSTEAIGFLGFKTPFFDKLMKNKEIIVDSTYKTNALDYELYSIIGQFDGSGFAMAYLFVEGKNKKDGAATEILALFFESLYNLGMNNIQFFLTDKDYTQISAAQKIWPNAKIQICLWHIKRALKKRLADNTPPKVITYSSYSANQVFRFIDIEFYSAMNEVQKKIFCFCSKEKRAIIIDMVEKHIHLHPLIPNSDGSFLTGQEIWKQSTYEMYKFCVDNDLRYVWAYMWCNWYRKETWILWARSEIPEKICLFRTTMLCESHWKVIKRNYLPKFFRPRLDLVIYIIITHMIPHNLHQYDRYFNNREKTSCCLAFLKSHFMLCKHLVQASAFNVNSSFFHKIKRQEVYPFIYLPHEQILNNSKENLTENLTENLSKNLFSNSKQDILKDVMNLENDNESLQLFSEYKTILQDALEIVREQENFDNIKWAQTVQNSFNGIEKMVMDIQSYKRKITNPRT
ncbi:28384_t:CDS:2 [Gigaspora margarita]|uniref:28384_t:CDS:1 n=1 Tax=Gigaspora margarita TaxID=4874 RepID=A0ABN7UQJ4_GIGMA|nr:28384_t:CDS:2 [Gigaspora margarita]